MNGDDKVSRRARFFLFPFLKPVVLLMESMLFSLLGVFDGFLTAIQSSSSSSRVPKNILRYMWVNFAIYAVVIYVPVIWYIRRKSAKAAKEEEENKDSSKKNADPKSKAMEKVIDYILGVATWKVVALFTGAIFQSVATLVDVKTRVEVLAISSSIVGVLCIVFTIWASRRLDQDFKSTANMFTFGEIVYLTGSNLAWMTSLLIVLTLDMATTRMKGSFNGYWIVFGISIVFGFIVLRMKQMYIRKRDRRSSRRTQVLMEEAVDPEDIVSFKIQIFTEFCIYFMAISFQRAVSYTFLTADSTQDQVNYSVGITIVGGFVAFLFEVILFRFRSSIKVFSQMILFNDISDMGIEVIAYLSGSSWGDLLSSLQTSTTTAAIIFFGTLAVAVLLTFIVFKLYSGTGVNLIAQMEFDEIGKPSQASIPAKSEPV
jgi:hypothetical protein